MKADIYTEAPRRSQKTKSRLDFELLPTCRCSHSSVGPQPDAQPEVSLVWGSPAPNQAVWHVLH